MPLGAWELLLGVSLEALDRASRAEEQLLECEQHCTRLTCDRQQQDTEDAGSIGFGF